MVTKRAGGRITDPSKTDGGAIRSSTPRDMTGAKPKSTINKGTPQIAGTMNWKKANKC